MRDITDSLDFILLNVGYSEMNANWNWTQIYSPFTRIYFVKSGEARTHIGNTTYTLTPDHLYLVPPFTLHDDECDGHFSLYYIHFYEKLINKESIFDRYEFPIGVDTLPMDLPLTERLLQINPNRHLSHFDPQFYDNPPSFSQYIADNNKLPLHSMIETQGIIFQLMSRFFEQSKPKSDDKDPRIGKCLQYIHENIGNVISVSQLADIACITEDHFIRIFRNKMSCTPIKYINMKKIEKAQLLLLTTEMTVRDIAFELSVDNVSYFNKIFKLQMGRTPSDYRKEYSR